MFRKQSHEDHPLRAQRRLHLRPQLRPLGEEAPGETGGVPAAHQRPVTGGQQPGAERAGEVSGAQDAHRRVHPGPEVLLAVEDLHLLLLLRTRLHKQGGSHPPHRHDGQTVSRKTRQSGSVQGYGRVRLWDGRENGVYCSEWLR